MNRYSDTLTATVRDATLDLLRELEMTSIFSNPGSTEVPFLAGLPDDLDFVLALHEGSVVGMATGWALAKGRPAFVLLHTTAGYGNAVSALATARTTRAPLVVVVGQQDRRHLATEPFLAGRLSGLGGDYPVWVQEPASARDVPGAILRAHHEAIAASGPAVVIVPMNDWAEPAAPRREWATPTTVVHAGSVDGALLDALCAEIDAAADPVLVVGAAADDDRTRVAVGLLADRLGAPIWQESFGARSGCDQDHPAFAGNLPADRPRLRQALAPHDLVVTLGAPAFRQYAFEEGPFVDPGTRVVVVSPHADEVHRSGADLAVLAATAPVCETLLERLAQRSARSPRGIERPAPPLPPAAGEPLRAGHVLAALAERLPAEAIMVEESPSSRPELEQRIVARQTLGYVCAAMGGLGFALPAAAGLKLGVPARPVVAVTGDGSAMYQIQSLWSAVRYGAGALFVVLSNGRYAIMDRLAERAGAAAPWPPFGDLSIAALAHAQGCEALRIVEHAELLRTFDDVLPTLAARRAPLVLDIAVAPDESYQP